MGTPIDRITIRRKVLRNADDSCIFYGHDESQSSMHREGSLPDLSSLTNTEDQIHELRAELETMVQKSKDNDIYTNLLLSDILDLKGDLSEQINLNDNLKRICSETTTPTKHLLNRNITTPKSANLQTCSNNLLKFNIENEIKNVQKLRNIIGEKEEVIENLKKEILSLSESVCKKDMKILELDSEVHKLQLAAFEMKTKLEERKRDTTTKYAVSALKTYRLSKKKLKKIRKQNKLITKLQKEKKSVVNANLLIKQKIARSAQNDQRAYHDEKNYRNIIHNKIITSEINVKKSNSIPELDSGQIIILSDKIGRDISKHIKNIRPSSQVINICKPGTSFDEIVRSAKSYTESLSENDLLVILVSDFIKIHHDHATYNKLLEQMLNSENCVCKIVISSFMYDNVNDKIIYAINQKIAHLAACTERVQYMELNSLSISKKCNKRDIAQNIINCVTAWRGTTRLRFIKLQNDSTTSCPKSNFIKRCNNLKMT